MKNIKIYLVLTLLLLTPLSKITLAKNYTAEEIETFAHKFLQENLPKPDEGVLEISVGNIDPRIKINSCESNLAANIPEINYSRNVNIKVFCDASNAWSIYLPVRISTIVPIVVASTQLNKGSILSEENLTVIYKDLRSIHGEHISDKNALIGTKTKRNISKNKALTQKNVCYVCKGDKVTIIAQSENLHIKTQGIALSSGAIGSTIRVENIKSGKTILAEVESINKVVINL